MKMVYTENYSPNSLYVWSGNNMAMVMLLKDGEDPKMLCLWSATNEAEKTSLKARFVRGFFKPKRISREGWTDVYDNVVKEVAEDSGFARLLQKIIIDKKTHWKVRQEIRLEKKDFRDLMEFASKKSNVKRPTFDARMEEAPAEELDKIAGVMADHFDEFVALRKLDKVV